MYIQNISGKLDKHTISVCKCMRTKYTLYLKCGFVQLMFLSLFFSSPPLSLILLCSEYLFIWLPTSVQRHSYVDSGSSVHRRWSSLCRQIWREGPVPWSPKFLQSLMINIGQKSKYVFNARTSSRKSTKIIYKFSMHSRSQCRITGPSMDGVVRISMNTEHLQKQQTVLSAVGSCAGPIMRTNPQPTADVNTLFSPPPRAPWPRNSAYWC